MNTSFTILLAEDDANEVFLMQRAFQKAGLKNPLHVACDGQEAIDYLSHQGQFSDTVRYPSPALMLLDLKMPRKNGFEVLEWLRQQPRSEEHTSELQSPCNLVCRLLLEKKKKKIQLARISDSKKSDRGSL